MFRVERHGRQHRMPGSVILERLAPRIGESKLIIVNPEVGLSRTKLVNPGVLVGDQPDFLAPLEKIPGKKGQGERKNRQGNQNPERQGPLAPYQRENLVENEKGQEDQHRRVKIFRPGTVINQVGIEQHHQEGDDRPQSGHRKEPQDGSPPGEPPPGKQGQNWKNGDQGIRQDQAEDGISRMPGQGKRLEDPEVGGQDRS